MNQLSNDATRRLETHCSRIVRTSTSPSELALLNWYRHHTLNQASSRYLTASSPMKDKRAVLSQLLWNHKPNYQKRGEHVTDVWGISFHERRCVIYLNKSGLGIQVEHQDESDEILWMLTMILIPTNSRELIEASEEAVGSAERVIALCEADVKAGNSPNQFERSMPSAALAECYAAMSFVGRLRKALEAVK